MKSLPTKYKGYNFRSRTEARWAVFFDAMRIKYLYEHEDVVLPSGRRYLPDFYLPNIEGGCYAEVKGKFDYEGLFTCLELSALTKRKVVLLEGVPDFKVYHFLICIGESIRALENDITIFKGIFSGPNSPQGERMLLKSDVLKNPNWGIEYINAVHAARGAQFEFLNQ